MPYIEECGIESRHLTLRKDLLWAPFLLRLSPRVWRFVLDFYLPSFSAIQRYLTVSFCLECCNLNCVFMRPSPRELQEEFVEKYVVLKRPLVPPDTQRIKSTGFQIAISSYFDSRINIYSSHLATLCSWWLRPHLRDACTQHRQYNFLWTGSVSF